MIPKARNTAIRHRSLYIALCAMLVSVLIVLWWGIDAGGIPLIVTSMAFTVMLMDSLIAKICGALFIFLITFGMWMPALGQITPHSRMANDYGDVYQISMAITLYHHENDASYPPNLAVLAEHNYVNLESNVWICPRGAGTRHTRKDGILPDLIFGIEPKPEPAAEITTPEDLIDGDYLYLPPMDAHPDTVILMTRPNLLYKHHVHVVRQKTPRPERLSERRMLKDTHVQLFLRAFANARKNRQSGINTIAPNQQGE